MTKEEIKKILNEHKKWLKEEGGECADLRYADLRGANLRDADLRYANLRGADLRYADLRNAELRNADLEDAKLIGAEINYPIVCHESGSFVAWKKCRGNI